MRKKMQSLYLTDYIKTFNNVIPPDICTDTVTELQDKKIWVRHSWTSYENNVEQVVTNNNVKDLSITSGIKGSSNTSYIMDSLFNVLKLYYNEISIPECDNWNGYTGIRYNRYTEGQVIYKHVDRITSMFDGKRKGIPTLSIVGLLNDDYEGGEFIMFDNKRIDIKAGSVIVFPSTFLYPHSVSQVTKGTRYSFVSWVW